MHDLDGVETPCETCPNFIDEIKPEVLGQKSHIAYNDWLFLNRDKPHYLGFGTSIIGSIPYQIVSQYCLQYDRDLETMERIIIIDNVASEEARKKRIKEAEEKEEKDRVKKQQIKSRQGRPYMGNRRR